MSTPIIDIAEFLKRAGVQKRYFARGGKIPPNPAWSRILSIDPKAREVQFLVTIPPGDIRGRYPTWFVYDYQSDLYGLGLSVMKVRFSGFFNHRTSAMPMWADGDVKGSELNLFNRDRIFCEELNMSMHQLARIRALIGRALQTGNWVIANCAFPVALGSAPPDVASQSKEDYSTWGLKVEQAARATPIFAEQALGDDAAREIERVKRFAGWGSYAAIGYSAHDIPHEALGTGVSVSSLTSSGATVVMQAPSGSGEAVVSDDLVTTVMDQLIRFGAFGWTGASRLFDVLEVSHPEEFLKRARYYIDAKPKNPAPVDEQQFIAAQSEMIVDKLRQSDDVMASASAWLTSLTNAITSLVREELDGS